MKNKNKPIVIIFEGIDKSGKTTIRDEFNKETNFKYVVLDRFTTSSKVYNELFNRNEYKYYSEVEKAFRNAFNVLIVLCECDEDTNKKRLKNANEILPKQLIDISKVKGLFEKEIKCFENVKKINTSNKNIKECVNEIILKVNEMEKMYG